MVSAMIMPLIRGFERRNGITGKIPTRWISIFEFSNKPPQK